MPVFACEAAVAGGAAVEEAGVSLIAMDAAPRTVGGTVVALLLVMLSCLLFLAPQPYCTLPKNVSVVTFPFSRNPPPMRTENRLIVENLSSRVSWQVSIGTRS